MSLSTVGNQPLTIAEHEKWGRQEWDRYLKQPDHNVMKECYLSTVVSQQKLMEEGLFEGREFYRQFPCLFPREINPLLKDHIGKPSDYRAAPFAITRTLFTREENGHPVDGLIIQREEGDPIVLVGMPWKVLPEDGEKNWRWGDMGWHELIAFGIGQDEIRQEVVDRIRNSKIPSAVKTILSDGILPPPLVGLVLQYVSGKLPSQQEQLMAERMREVRHSLYETFRRHAIQSFGLDKDAYFSLWGKSWGVVHFERIAGTIAQYLEGTGVDKTSPEDLATAAENGVELPLHLQTIGVNAVDEWEMTALHHAASKGHATAARALIQAGANCNLGQWGRTPLELALGSKETALEILPHTQMISFDTLEGMILRERIDCLIQAAKQIPDLGHIRDAQGNSIVHWIVQNRSARFSEKIELLEQLKHHKTNLCTPNHEGITPLHLAAAQKPQEMLMQTIARVPADYNVQDRHGNTPLMWALFQGDPEAAKFELQTELVQLKEKIASASLIGLRTLNRCLHAVICRKPKKD